jgi:hypothetical protein
VKTPASITTVIATACAWLLCAAAHGAPPPPPPPPAPAPGIDFHTVLLEPAPSGRVRVTAFFGFNPPAGDAPAHLFIPVDGEPRAMVAQPISRADFDARWVHRAEMEGAFYSWSRAQRNADWLVRGAIGLSGGPPAWIVLAARWPRHGPAVTAVAPPEATPGPGWQLVEARLLVSEEEFRKLPAGTHAVAAAAMRRSNSASVIAVAVRPAAGFKAEPTRPAAHGVRIAYEAPLRQEAGRRVLLTPCVAGASPALTRLYARSPWHGRLEVELPAGTQQAAQSQALVARALAGFDQPPAPESRRRAVNLATVRALDGRLTTRLVGTFGPWTEDADVLFDFSPVESLSPARTGIGASLLLAAWPGVIAAYVVTLLMAARFYLWVLGAPAAAFNRKRFLLLAFLGPLATPWALLKLLAPKELPAPAREEEGALSVLAPRDYDAVARLILWAALVCVNWFVILSIVRTGLALRYG